MADSQYNDGNLYDPGLGEIFAFGEYYQEDTANFAAVPGLESSNPPPLDAGSTNLTASLEPYQEHPSNTPAASWQSQTVSMHGEFGSLDGPSPSAEIGTGPPQQLEQGSNTNTSLDGIQEIDLELKQIELELKRNELLKKRRALLPKQPPPQQEQLTDHTSSQHDQNPKASSDGIASMTDLATTSENTNHLGLLFVSTGLGVV